jgi:ABC-type multidrug transport system fused ATPase/permease subunit
VSSCIELASLASLIPLSRLAANQAFRPDSPWARIPQSLGFEPDAKFYASAFLVLLLMRALTQIVAALMTAHLHRSLIAHFSSRALEAYVRHLDFAQVQSESIGHFMTIAGEDANRAANIVSAIMKFIPLVAIFLLYAGLIVYQSWRLGAGLAGLAVIILVCLWSVFRASHALGARQQLESRALNTHFLESLSGLRTVRALSGERFVSARYDEMISRYARTCFSMDGLNQLASMLPTIVLVTVLLAACWLSSGPFLTAALPAIMVGAIMVLRLLPLAAQALDIIQRLASDLKVAETISELLRAVRSARSAEANPLPALSEPIRSIEFDHVSFRYGAATPKVLDKFRAQFAAGKSYAISGPSGAGKSTIVDLLLKFYAPQAGVIRVNGKDIQALSAESLRKRVMLAEQAVRIFYDTIEHNIQFGRNATSQDVLRSLDMVGLSEFLDSLPEGRHTLLNYQGSNVSGGQRQRIGLARALLLQADVLIMDESTSALDKATRERILDKVLPLYRDRIVIFIAHDPAIWERVDEVIHLGDVAPSYPVASVAG